MRIYIEFNASEANTYVIGEVLQEIKISISGPDIGQSLGLLFQQIECLLKIMLYHQAHAFRGIFQ